ncbi:MAG TPA: hypothetical protein PL070_21615, partial [Flavobacteriales bacterium]|nr:hypothetical protein [Flavobacteriales bacterium]
LFPALLSLTTATAQIGINGPMAGPPDLMETTIWMQCHGPCGAYLTYWPAAEPNKAIRTIPQTSDPGKGHAMDFTLGPLVPGTEYRYTVSTTGQPGLKDTLSFRTQTLWKFRTD